MEPSARPVLNPFQPIRQFCSLLSEERFRGLLIYSVAFLAIAQLTRGALLLKSWGDAASGADLPAAFGWGLLFDLGAAAFSSLPLIVLLSALPAGWGGRAWQRGVTYAGGAVILFALLFGAVAEWTFWDEFGARFNFIAVDYLVYTTEVVGNIRESYNLPLIFSGLALATTIITAIVLATGLPRRWLQCAHAPARRRWAAGAVWFALAVALGLALDESHLPAFANNYHRELAKNGLWSLFAAFRSNSLDYDRFYRTLPPEMAFARLRQELVQDGSVLLHPGAPDTLRYVANPGPELRPNVIQITVESLSADFLGAFNRASRLTPNLDALAQHSLMFENFYATGTRTDRGMEALALSLPPTPGRSMIKRPRNEGLFTLGSVFRAKGYDTAFIYGGYGYFDNMNAFFGGNGYRIVDRNSVQSGDITFANAWGACDEDVYRWTLREADNAVAAGKPFHFFVMTTSNHRPYTYPEGRIDLPPKVSGRAGAVKYTDYAIGKFLRDAATRPWFRNTIFVIVADHCASSAGKAELPVQNYHIPLLIHAPGGQIAPGRVATLTSQMDYAPTLLGLLNWSYPSRFFGHDVRKIPPGDAHALLGTYQKLGHLEKDELIVLSPQAGRQTYSVRLADGTQKPSGHSDYAEQEAISFYASASYLWKNGGYRALGADEFAAYQAQGERLTTALRRSQGHSASNP